MMDAAKNITADYFLTGVTHQLFKTYSREVTVLASTCSVIALMILGSCIWCIAKLCKNRSVKASHSDSSDSASSEHPVSFFEGWRHSKTNGKTMNVANGKRKLMIHKNIVTPDKTIEFVVPTIQMPAQPSATQRERITEEQPSCSKSLQRQGSISSQYYPQLTNGDKCPQLGFSLYYEAATQILYLRLLGGQNFPEKLRHCIIVKLYPGRGGKQRTKDFEETMPIYNQEFSFHIRKCTLNTRILRIKAVIPGTPKRVIGCINLALKELAGFEAEDITEDLQSLQIWKNLEQPSDLSGGVKLQISLKWQQEPQPGLLTLKIIEAQGLHEANDNDFTSSHVKVTLQEQGRNIKSRKTRLIRWGSIPVFDDVFVVTIPQDLLGQISFLMEVIARGRLGSKVVLGKISIGGMPFSNPSTEGLAFWEDMCHQPNTEVVRWLQLLP